MASSQFLDLAAHALGLVARMISSDNMAGVSTPSGQARPCARWAFAQRHGAPTPSTFLYGLLMLYRRHGRQRLLGRKISQVRRMGRELGLLGLAHGQQDAALLRCFWCRSPMHAGYHAAQDLVAGGPPRHGKGLVGHQLAGVAHARTAGPFRDGQSLQAGLRLTQFRIGWLNERMLNHCKPGQLWVGVSRSSLFVRRGAGPDGALAAAGRRLPHGRCQSVLLPKAHRCISGLPQPAPWTPRLGISTRARPSCDASWYGFLRTASDTRRSRPWPDPGRTRAKRQRLLRCSRFQVRHDMSDTMRTTRRRVTASQWAARDARVSPR